MFSMNSVNSMTIIFVITVKGLDPVASVLARQDLQIEPNSCFIGLTYESSAPFRKNSINIVSCDFYFQ